MAVTVGKGLRIVDNTSETSTGKVFLETIDKLSNDAGYLLFENDNTGTSSDTGFTISFYSRFIEEDITPTTSYYYLQTSGSTCELSTRSVIGFDGSRILAIPKAVRKSYFGIEFTWVGLLTDLSNLKVSFILESVVK